jgi:hypothetical protein
MHRLTLLVPLVGVSLALGVGETAAAMKEYCCWRVHVVGSSSFSADHGNEAEAGQANGTYAYATQWEVRELMSFSVSRFRQRRSLERVRTPSGREAVGRSRLRYSERSEQSEIDSNGQSVPYGACRFSAELPWHRPLGAQRVNLSDGPGRYLDAGADSDIAQPRCDHNPPYYSPLDNGWERPRFPSSRVTPTGFRQDGLFLRPDFPRADGVRRVKRKRYEYAFDSGAKRFDDPNDDRYDHTWQASVRGAVTLTWFPRDALRREVEAMNKLRR